MRLPRSARRTLLGATLAAVLLPGSAAAFDRGFNDYNLSLFADGTPAGSTALADGLQHAEAAGAKYWRYGITWSDVVSTQPVNAADPASPQYDWTHTDEVLRAVRAAGLSPVIWFYSAPTWAEGAGRPAVSRVAPAHAWKPDPKAFGAFATAFATRYSGRYPDPLTPGTSLPSVAAYQGWNEPNLSIALAPQWERSGGRWTFTGGRLYRNLQNAAYDGIKKASPSALVLTTGLAPYGDPNPGDPRSAPTFFWRSVFCETLKNGHPIAAKSCPRMRFDGWAHHPYSVNGPTTHALNVDDVTVPDLEKLTRVFRAAYRAGIAGNAPTRNVWITELSWDSSPDPDGLSPATQASYLSRAFYELWSAGADHILWWNSRDDPKGADGWGSTLQSGVFYRGATPALDQPKPSLAAYRLPFEAIRKGPRVLVWSAPLGSGAVSIQAQRGGSWTQVASITPASSGVAVRRLKLARGTVLRAVQGADISLTRRVQ